jgi:hypothetical protein
MGGCQSSTPVAKDAPNCSGLMIVVDTGPLGTPLISATDRANFMLSKECPQLILGEAVHLFKDDPARLRAAADYLERAV